MNPAKKAIIPLLDALKWQGDNSKIREAVVEENGEMDTELLLETMANLNFKNFKLGHLSGNDYLNVVFPLMIDTGSNYYVLVNIDDDFALVFDCNQEKYRQAEIKSLRGEAYAFQYAQDIAESLIQPQGNWFNKLLYRFRLAFAQVALLTFLLTLLNLLLPVFVILMFDRMLTSDNITPLLIIFGGVLIYLISSYFLNSIRSSLLNYTSTRMGNIVLSQTYTRLMYLSPSYTETASPTSQMSRIKDFENIKHFIISGGFVSAFDLLFSPIYIIALIFIGGWIGVVPLVTLAVLIIIGLILRPFHKLKMERVSETSSKRQQSLLEILNNTDKIKSSGIKNVWLNRMKRHIGNHIESNYELSGYISTTNNVSYFVTNFSVLIMIYGGVMQVFAGNMSTGLLMGTLILAWKTMNPIRGAFSMAVQINGLLKSINQINRFMKLPQDNNLKTTMITNKEIKGHIRFIDVSIKYNPTSSPALLGVSFEAKPLEIVGITGHDGAGKSTILKLILGMYHPQAGRIIIDDMNIKQMEPLSLRRSISYASERDLLLTSTIRDCFRSYKPDIEDEDIIYLCEQTGFMEYMKLYNYSLDTFLSTKELQKMSSASKKLLNLARMLARRAKIYLVDEMEDHLDRDTINKMLDLIIRTAKQNNATVIVSSKDEGILSRCNKVIKLESGRAKKIEKARKEVS